MSHPPIPPNCEHLREAGDSVLLCAGGKIIGSIQDFNARPQALRPIVAAVARCAWLDERDRNAKLCDDTYVDSEHPCYGLSQSAEHEAAWEATKTCAKNAKAWKEWGSV